MRTAGGRSGCEGTTSTANNQPHESNEALVKALFCGTISRALPYIAGMRIPAALVILLLSMLGLSASGFAFDLALIHAKIYSSPTNAPIEDGTIVIHNGRITAIGPRTSTKPPRFARAVTVINCKGLVVTAGFWNSHVHIFTKGLLHAETLSASNLSSQLEQMLTRWGFTSVVDIASVLDNTNAIRRRINSGEVRGPHILSVGEPFYAKGGTPVYIRGFLDENHLAIPEVESAPQAVMRVRQQIHDGADGIKLFAGSIEPDSVLIMPLNLASAIVFEAHRAGKPVFSHPSNNEGIELSLQSGVDILAHTTPMSGPWTADLVQRMRTANIAPFPPLLCLKSRLRNSASRPRMQRTTCTTHPSSLSHIPTPAAKSSLVPMSATRTTLTPPRSLT